MSALTRLVIDPSDTDVMYLAGGPGIFRSLDGGMTWGKIAPGNCSEYSCMLPSALLLDPTSPDTLYFERSDLGALQVSHDGGETWAPIGDGQPSAVTLDPSTTPATIYVTRSDGSLWRSPDQGTTWVPGDDSSSSGDGSTTSIALGGEESVPGVQSDARVLYVAGASLTKSTFVAATPQVKIAIAVSKPPQRVHVAARQFSITVRCAVTWKQDCSGHVELRRNHVVTARGSFTAPPGGSATIEFTLGPDAARDLQKHKNRRYTAYAISQGSDRTRVTDNRLVVLTVH